MLTPFSPLAHSFGPTFRTSSPQAVPRTGLHRSTHLGLISLVPRYGVLARRAGVPLSAVVVPTSRPAEGVSSGLGLAARCAEAQGTQLVVIRSGAASRASFPPYLAPLGSPPTLVIDLPDQADLLLPHLRNLRSNEHRVATLHRNSDVGLKRNLALLLGHLCGWGCIALLDDDLTTRRASQVPSPSTVDSADPLLRLDDVLADFAEYPELRAAGYLQKDFDDNSVVCHVRRLAGWPQEGFISGGAMVVRCGRDLPFFPSAYNEDWLFIFSLIMQGRHTHPSSTVKLVGTVHQDAYYPFSAPRARSEELGDVFAEGLFSLLDETRDTVYSLARSPQYWQDVIGRRQNMILNLLLELRTEYSFQASGLLSDVDESLRAALGVYQGSITAWAAELSGYFSRLMADLDEWHTQLDRLAPANPASSLELDEALATLELSPYVTRVNARSPRLRSGEGAPHPTGHPTPAGTRRMSPPQELRPAAGL